MMGQLVKVEQAALAIADLAFEAGQAYYRSKRVSARDMQYMRWWALLDAYTLVMTGLHGEEFAAVAKQVQEDRITEWTRSQGGERRIV